MIDSLNEDIIETDDETADTVVLPQKPNYTALLTWGTIAFIYSVGIAFAIWFVLH